MLARMRRRGLPEEQTVLQWRRVRHRSVVNWGGLAPRKKIPVYNCWFCYHFSTSCSKTILQASTMALSADKTCTNVWLKGLRTEDMFGETSITLLILCSPGLDDDALLATPSRWNEALMLYKYHDKLCSASSRLAPAMKWCVPVLNRLHLNTSAE